MYLMEQTRCKRDDLAVTAAALLDGNRPVGIRKC
jgi:hypothetical protein